MVINPININKKRNGRSEVTEIMCGNNLVERSFLIVLAKDTEIIHSYSHVQYHKRVTPFVVDSSTSEDHVASNSNGVNIITITELQKRSEMKKIILMEVYATLVRKINSELG